VSYRVVVAISGRGSNLVALLDALAHDDVARVVLVISDRAAEGLERAAERGVAIHRLADFRDGTEWRRILTNSGCDLLVLAGYLRLVPADVVHQMSGRIINVHPALLPKFGGTGMHGARVHEAVLASGDVESGATVHMVDEAYDRGRVLAQARVAVPANRSAATLAAAVLEIEHRLLPAAVRAAAIAGHPVPFIFA